MIDKLPHTFEMSDVPEELLTHKVVQALSKRQPTPVIKELDEINDKFLRGTEDFRLKQRYSDDNQEDNHLSREVLKHKRWNKKRKHIKDDTRHHEKYKNAYGKFRYTLRGFKVVPMSTHKHLRSQKVYLEEEYYDTDSAFWFDCGELEWYGYNEVDTELQRYLLGYQHCSCELCLEGLNNELLKRGLSLSDFNLE